MPRRIIYIQKPTRGGHFRTFGGPGGRAAPKPPRDKRPGTRTTTPSTWGFGAVGFAGTYTLGKPSWNSWWTSFPNTTQLPEEIFAPEADIPISSNDPTGFFYEQGVNSFAPISADYALGAPNPYVSAGLSDGAPNPYASTGISTGAPNPYVAAGLATGAPNNYASAYQSMGAPNPYTSAGPSTGAPDNYTSAGLSTGAPDN